MRSAVSSVLVAVLVYTAAMLVPLAVASQETLPASVHDGLQLAANQRALVGISTAVVMTIASHPELVSEIIREAIRLAPAEADKIIAVAKTSFPGFADNIQLAAVSVKTTAMPIAASAETKGKLPLETVQQPSGQSISEHAVIAAGEAPGKTFKDGIYLAKPEYFGSYFQNTWRIIAGPANYDRGDWISIGIVAGVGGSLLLLDDWINDFWRDNVKGDTTDSATSILEGFGDTDYIAAGTLAGYLLAETFGLEREKSAMLLTLESAILATAATEGLKYATGRVRPDDAKNQYDWDGPTSKANTAFPSGHASKAFSVASVISETYAGDYPWVPWIAYPLATGTALARIDKERHWASDVFVGAAIGYFTGKLVTRHNPFLERYDLTLVPSISNGVTELKVVHRL